MCKLLLRHNGRPNSPLIRQKHEMIRKCLTSGCYFHSALRHCSLFLLHTGVEILPFFWLDAHENMYQFPGTVYLFGKVWVQQAETHVRLAPSHSRVPLYCMYDYRIVGYFRGVYISQISNCCDSWMNFFFAKLIENHTHIPSVATSWVQSS